jgi:creatinine amidohydrolase
MRLTTLLTASFLLIGILAAGAQPPGGGPPLTPEQEELRRIRQAAAAPDAPRPIEMLDTVWMEEMSWMEVRDALRAGKTTAILGSGGVEQNGPYTATGKHNYVLRATCEATARLLGNALCAPIVNHEPGNPDREDLTPGVFFITQETYKAILTDVSTSLKNMGFTDIVMIADSGGNVTGMTDVAAALNAKWHGTPARVYYIDEYYEEDKWSFDFLKTIGIHQQPDVQSATRYDIHDDYHYQALVALTDPKLIRAEQRIAAGHFVINKVPMESVEKVLENGRKIQQHRAGITARAIRKAMAEARARPR